MAAGGASVSKLTLAIETSNPTSGPRGPVPMDRQTVLAGPGVALGRPGRGGIHFTELIDAEPLTDSLHADDLASAIDRLFRRCRAAPGDLSHVAVSIGPGGYTSLRIAVATAKMIAEATGASILAVPSAAVAAWCIPIGSAPALVCLASKADSTHVTLLPSSPRQGAWWEQTGRAQAAKLLGKEAYAELVSEMEAGRGWISAAAHIGVIGAHEVEALRPATLIADRYLPQSIRDTAARLGAPVVEPIFAASSLLDILYEEWPPADPITLAPVYPREPDAVTQWRRRKSGPNAPRSV